MELEVGAGIFQAGNKNEKIAMFAQSWVNKSIICSAGQNNFHFVEGKKKTKKLLKCFKLLNSSRFEFGRKLFIPALS